MRPNMRPNTRPPETTITHNTIAHDYSTITITITHILIRTTRTPMGYGQSDDYTDFPATGSNNADDYVIGSVVAPGFDADQVERENGFRDIPPGEHLLIVQDVVLYEAAFTYVTLDGRPSGYTSRSALVRLAMPNDKRATISDFFTLPPGNPSELNAYFHGVPKPKEGEAPKPDAKGGFAANKFFYFMDRLGFVDPATKALTPAGGRISSWKGQAIYATITAGKGTYTNKKGDTVARGSQIKMFSYRRADATANQVQGGGQQGGQQGGQPNNQPGQPSGQPINRPQHAPSPPPFTPSRSTNVDDVLANI